MLFAKRLKARLTAIVPLVTLGGTLGAAAAIHHQQDARGALVGLAEGTPESIAALEMARITAIHVAVGEEVQPNQLIATLDTSAIDGEIAIAQADKHRLEAEVKAERMLLGRRLDVDRETVEREARREQEDLVRVNAESRALDSEIERVTRLVAAHQAVAGELAQLNLRRAQLSSLAREKPLTLGVLTRQLGAAARRRSEVDESSSAGAAKYDAELTVVQRRIDLLEKRRASFFLRASGKGRVASLDKRAGETAAPGETIVKVVRASGNVVVCVPERLSLGLREGDGARLWIRGQRAAPLAGRTVTVGPMVAALPDRCWPTPKLPVWGREVTVAIDGPIDVIAGTTFDVVLDGTPAPPLPSPNDTSNPVAKRADRTGPARLEPHPMLVPASLARRTRFEPSGVLVRPDEDRYLVVSDDTGIKDGADDGRPWLFSVDRTGAVDAEPIPIRGVSAIDDLESIAAGDAGEVYVLSSQSRSKKGWRRPARSALLRLRPERSGFAVDGEVHLAELLDDVPERARALGLTNGTRDLDVEGMTRQDGALYLGLKAPLDAAGNAIIWKITAPEVLFDRSTTASKRLEAFSVWGNVRVDVELDGHVVPGGISELLFVDKESLVIASTPSTAEGAAGAIWHVEHARGGTLVPRLVRSFPNRKPEGVTPSLTPGNLLVVFDAGSATPSFLEMPWPP